MATYYRFHARARNGGQQLSWRRLIETHLEWPRTSQDVREKETLLNLADKKRRRDSENRGANLQRPVSHSHPDIETTKSRWRRLDRRSFNDGR